MQRFTIRRVSKLTSLELDFISRILAISGKDDPLPKSACNGGMRLLTEYYRSLLKASTVGGGHIFVASYDDGDCYPMNVVGCVVCFGPGKGLLKDEQQRMQGFNRFLLMLSPDALEWWTHSFLPRYNYISNALMGPATKSNSWTLNLLAVDPNFRGRGVGRALAETGEALARRDGLPVVFETESGRNMGLYQHWGYTPLGELELDTGRGTPLTWRAYKKAPVVSSPTTATAATAAAVAELQNQLEALQHQHQHQQREDAARTRAGVRAGRGPVVEV